jgi:hypothetical protein
MELTQAQIDFRNKLQELADRAGSALVLPDNSQMDAEAFLKAIDKSEVESTLNELGVEKKSEEYEDGEPYTGDEIHFTDGTIWSCLLYSSLIILPEGDCVVFIPISFKRWLDGEFVGDPYFVDEVRPLLKDALKGGAKIVRGVGLAKDN